MKTPEIKAKKLKHKAETVMEKLKSIQLCNDMPDLQLLIQPSETKKELWLAIDHLKCFIDNIQ